ncbi:hypothetical protein [Yoonia sp. SDW83-1]|uniref:hypothetical protein n=1 Tax=Yoonia sp. SDW83-1 TaxID=3366945 RepID=UPI00398C7022
MFRSLALASDALVMQGQSVFEAYEDRVVMQTPDEPDYRHGNLVIMKHPPGDALAQVSQFQTDFPDATHRTIIWDVPGLDPAPLAAVLIPHGYELGTSDTPPSILRYGTPDRRMALSCARWPVRLTGPL